MIHFYEPHKSGIGEKEASWYDFYSIPDSKGHGYEYLHVDENKTITKKKKIGGIDYKNYRTFISKKKLLIFISKKAIISYKRVI